MTMDNTTSTVDVRAIGVGFAAAFVVLMLFVWVVGVSAVIDALFSAKLWVLPLILITAFVWLLVWSFSLDVVLSLLGVTHTRLQTLGIYLGIVFANNVTPFAQAGAEPFGALIVSRATNSRFEVGLSAVTSVDALNVLPSIGLAAVGLIYIVLNTTLNPRVELAAILFLGLAVVVCLSALFAWQHRTSIELILQRFAVKIESLLDRILSRSKYFKTPELTDRVSGFISGLEQISRNPTQLSVALAFSTVGWLCLVVALWLSLYAVGYVTPIEIVLFVVPLAVAASVTPLPGGVGGIEAAYVFLLVSLTPIPTPTVTAAVLIYRTGTFLLPIIAGGGAIALLGVTNSTSEGTT